MKKVIVDGKKRIEFLRRALEQHNRLYYVENTPQISDFEYDLLMQELQTLELQFPQFSSDNSPAQKVGSDLFSSNFKQIKHSSPMLSLSNSYNKGELYAFHERVSKLISEEPSYVCELKIDGSAISLLYRDGRLLRALTRGDGVEGDEVTENIKRIEGVLLKINPSSPIKDFEVRGEIYMRYSDFERLNREREERGEPLFANPRNAAAGSLKLLNSDEVAKRGLRLALYSVVDSNLPFKSHLEGLEWAQKSGFLLSQENRECHSIEEVIDYIEKWELMRKELDYPTDGVVIKVNSLEKQRELGATSKFPRWATAFKFKAEQALSKLISIDYQVGRTGAITPVANLEATLLSGSTIRRASLHNQDQMELLDIRIGDTLYIEKGGEIIPKIVGIELSKRESNAVKPTFPTHCPDCGSQLIKEEREAKHYCPNYNGCPMQIKGRFLHFSSRKAMNILIGEATIEQMFNRGFIKELNDLYQLSQEQLLQLEGWGQRSVDRFLSSIERSKETPFHRVLYALGIRYVGESSAQKIVSHFGSIKPLIAASKEELLMVDEVGDSIAESLLQFFSKSENLLLIERLQLAGLNFREKEEKIEEVLSQRLEGKSVVVSGRFSIAREELKKLISSHGGKNVSSLSSSTSYLIAGEKMGPAKLNRAKELKINILTEEDFFKLIN